MGQWLSTLDEAPGRPVRYVEPEYFIVCNDAARATEASWHVFAPNRVRSTAYPTVAAIPIALVVQLRSVVLVFHFVVALFTLIRPVGHPDPWFRFAPWLVVWVVAAVPRLVAHFQVSAQDEQLNGAKVTKVTPLPQVNDDDDDVNDGVGNAIPPTTPARQRRGRRPAQDTRPVNLEDVRWDSVVPGDVVLLRRHDRAGADLALLSSSNDDSVTALIDAGSSTGETELRPVQSLLPAELAGKLKTPRAAAATRLALKVPFPKSDASLWSTRIYDATAIPKSARTADDIATAMKDIKPMATSTNLALMPRGSVLRATEWVWAVVLYTGADTLQERGKPKPRTRFMAPATVSRLTFIVAAVCGVVAVAVVLATFAWFQADSDTTTHLDQWHIAAVDAYGPEGERELSGLHVWAVSFAYAVIVVASVLPIWLDCFDAACVAIHAHLVRRVLSVKPAPDAPASEEKHLATVARLTSLTRVPNVTHAFLDKTGTITRNRMSPVAAHVLGTGLTLDTDEGRDAARQHMRSAETRPRLAQFWLGCALANQVYPYLVSVAKNSSNHTTPQPSLLLLPSDAKQPAAKQDTTKTEYRLDATSSDEEALVYAAAEQGYRLVGRTGTTATLRIHGVRKPQVFRIHCVIDFTADRRRMTVVLQEPAGGEFVVFMKGAFDAVQPTLRRGFPNSKFLPAAAEAAAQHASKGYRPFAFAVRRPNPEDARAWLAKRAEIANAADPTVYTAEPTTKKSKKAAAVVADADEVKASREQRLYAARMAALAAHDREMERDMMLMGVATVADEIDVDAIAGVGALRRAGLSTWMVTGDSRLAAVAVSKQIQLGWRDDEEPLLRQIDVSAIATTDRVAMCTSQLQRALQALDRPTKRPIVLVIDGPSFTIVLETPSLRKLFVEVCGRLAGGIACRFAPDQKAKLLLLFRKEVDEADVQTLAVGDGANDAGMLEEAHVGVALTSGEASLTARRAADVTLPHLSLVMGFRGIGCIAADRGTAAFRWLVGCGLFFATLRLALVVYPGRMRSAGFGLAEGHMLALEWFVAPAVIAAVLAVVEPPLWRFQTDDALALFHRYRLSFAAVPFALALLTYAVLLPMVTTTVGSMNTPHIAAVASLGSLPLLTWASLQLLWPQVMRLPALLAAGATAVLGPLAVLVVSAASRRSEPLHWWALQDALGTTEGWAALLLWCVAVPSVTVVGLGGAFRSTQQQPSAHVRQSAVERVRALCDEEKLGLVEGRVKWASIERGKNGRSPAATTSV